MSKTCSPSRSKAIGSSLRIVTTQGAIGSQVYFLQHCRL